MDNGILSVQFPKASEQQAHKKITNDQLSARLMCYYNTIYLYC